MFLQYISDIHLECHDTLDKESLTPEIFVKPVAPYLALCGDIGIPELKTYRVFLEWCSQRWKHVFLVAGNHEYYNLPLQTKATLDEKAALLREICNTFSNVHFLDCDTYWLEEEKIHILGCTLWSYIHDDLLDMASYSMNHYKQIYGESGEHIFPDHLREIHLEETEWIVSQLQEIQAKGEKCIVLTHHLPSFQLIHEKYEGHPLNSCFASNLHYLIRQPVCAWLCGHSHTGKDIYINQVFCSLNPYGYPEEGVETKNCEKVVEVKTEIFLSEILDLHHM